MLYMKDRTFFPRMITLVAPMLLQNLLSSSLNFIDVFMIGQLGETAIAAVGSANQYFFVFLMLAFGFASGSAIFTAQYWGNNDIKNIRSVMGIGLTLTLAISIIFSIATFLFPSGVLGMFTKDSAVIELGAEYLSIVVWCFVITAVNISFGVVLRSTERVLLPMVASITGIVINTSLNYLLIFGEFGFPELGVKGAAYATLIARSVELLIVVTVTYIQKLPAAAGLSDLFHFTSEQVKKYLAKATPVIVQSAGWAFGFSAYTMIYGHISTESLAAYNISGSIQRICLIFFTGLSSACSIMVGNRIGAGEEEKAEGFAKNFLILGVATSFFVAATLFLLRGRIIGFYELNQLTQEYMNGILIVMAAILWANAANILFHGGIFKAGGDTLFSMIVDVGFIWIIGIPIALITAFYFKLPIHYVMAFITIEEVIKVFVGFKRFKSNKWLNNLIA